MTAATEADSLRPTTALPCDRPSPPGHDYYAVRASTAAARSLVRVDVALLREQREVWEANERVRRRMA